MVLLLQKRVTGKRFNECCKYPRIFPVLEDLQGHHVSFFQRAGWLDTTAVPLIHSHTQSTTENVQLSLWLSLWKTRHSHRRACKTALPTALTQERQLHLPNLSTGLYYPSLVEQRYNYRYRDLDIKFKEGYVSKKVWFKN